MSFTGFSEKRRDGEIVLEARPAWRSYATHFIVTIGALLLDVFRVEVAVFLLEYLGIEIGQTWLSIIHVVLLIVPAIAVLNIARHRFSRKYIVRNDNRIISEHGYIGRHERSVPIQGVSIEVIQPFWGAIFDFGDLWFRPGTEQPECIWEGVISPRKLRKDIENYSQTQRVVGQQLSQAKKPTNSDAGLEDPYWIVPEGVEFSRRVIQLPSFHESLADLIYRNYATTNIFNPLIGNHSHWIRRGDKLCNLPGMSNEDAIVAPVSGLLLHHTGSISNWSSSGGPRFLLPKCEDDPLSVARMMSGLRSYFLNDVRNFTRHGFYKSFSVEKMQAHIEQALEEQLAGSYKFTDMRNENWNRSWYDEQFPDRPDIERALKPMLDDMHP